ncbi:MAG: hypothetical protein PHN75_18075 [Syntrophales bacterium]|nr:hypothetical protein [Syntrophales bacterium]
MNKKLIKQSIIDRVESCKTVKFPVWTIGLTHDPKETKRQYDAAGKFTTYWIQWDADSVADAQEIESFFINTKRMREGAPDDINEGKTVYVYIF